MMLTKEAYDKFMEGIQKKIDETDKLMKQNAEATLQSIYDGYKKRLMDKIEFEMQQIELAKMQGNEPVQKHHEMLAGIYKSILDIDIGNAKLVLAAIALSSIMLHVGIPPKLSVFATVFQPMMRGNI
jgi:CHASE3 domain sensor protein